MIRRSASACLAAMLLLSSCALFGDRKKDPETAPERSPGGVSVPIGEIAYVNSDAGFVLVRTGKTIQLKQGTELEARLGMTPTAILDASPERKRGFVTADIVQGAPQLGDSVFVRVTPQPDLEQRQAAMRQRAEAIGQAQKSATIERGRKRLRKK